MALITFPVLILWQWRVNYKEMTVFKGMKSLFDV